MTAIAQRKYLFKFKIPIKPFKPNIVHMPKNEWAENKVRMFKWAENQSAKHGYSGNVHNLLKELINCTDNKGKTSATIETLHNRMVSRHGKGAPSKRTIERYLAKLVENKTIKRSTQQSYKSLITTRLLMGKSVDRSTSLCRAEYISNKRYIYGEEVTALPPPPPSTSNLKNESRSKPTAIAPPSLSGGVLALASEDGNQEEHWADAEVTRRAAECIERMKARGVIQ